jgi:hypothetical protein
LTDCSNYCRRLRQIAAHCGERPHRLVPGLTGIDLPIQGGERRERPTIHAFLPLTNPRQPPCGRRVAVLYLAGELFACRRCYQLAYESQQQRPPWRSMSGSLKIRRRLSGSPDPFEPFPEKPHGMHRRTYLRLRARAEAAEAIAFGAPLDVRLRRRTRSGYWIVASANFCESLVKVPVSVPR